jgi:hypothetical protein
MNKIRKSFLWKIENDAGNLSRYVPGPGKYPRMKTKLEESEL